MLFVALAGSAVEAQVAPRPDGPRVAPGDRPVRQAPPGPHLVVRPPTSYVSETAAAAAHARLCELLAKVAPGLVTVLCERTSPPHASGTGFFVSPDGLVATSLYLLADKALAGVRIQTLGKEPMDAAVVAMDVKAGLAILKPAKPLLGAYVLRGRNLAGPPADKTAFSLGYPARPWFAFCRIAARDLYPGEALEQAMSGRIAVRKDRNYIETDCGFTRGTLGGPMVDSTGKVIAVGSLRVPHSKMAFAIESRAVADLAGQAARAKPLSMDAVRAAAEENTLAERFGKATSPHDVRAAVSRHRWVMYCPKCHGSGSVTVTRKESKLVRKPYKVLTGTRTITRYRTVTVTETIRERSRCPTCRGRQVNPDRNSVYAGLCAILQPLISLDHNSLGAAAVWQSACGVFDHAAILDSAYQRDLSRRAGMALSLAKERIGDPVVFTGTVRNVRGLGDISILLVCTPVYPSRYVLVAHRSSRVSYPGQECLVAGATAGLIEQTPCVLAAAVSELHAANPAYKPKPRAIVTRWAERPSSSAPADSPAGKRLKTARMYLSGGLRKKAGEILREIIKKHPDSPEAAEAEKLLADPGLQTP